jgi:hypothetical protein
MKTISDFSKEKKKGQLAFTAHNSTITFTIVKPRSQLITQENYMQSEVYHFNNTSPVVFQNSERSYAKDYYNLHVDVGRVNLTHEFKKVEAEIELSKETAPDPVPKLKKKYKKKSLNDKDMAKSSLDRNIVNDFNKGYNAMAWYKKHYNVSPDYVRGIILEYKLNLENEYKFKCNRSAPSTNELDFIKEYFLLE